MRLGRAVAATAALALLGPAAPAAETADLRVLYAGNVDSPRGKDFLSFLAQHFAKVTPVELGKFREADAKGHDVVLFDWTSIYPRDKDGKITNDDKSPGITMPPAPRLSPDFDRPAVLIGAAGGQVSQGLQIKINWL
jgi:hypothetical protein